MPSVNSNILQVTLQVQMNYYKQLDVTLMQPAALCMCILKVHPVALHSQQQTITCVGRKKIKIIEMNYLHTCKHTVIQFSSSHSFVFPIPSFHLSRDIAFWTISLSLFTLQFLQWFLNHTERKTLGEILWNKFN